MWREIRRDTEGDPDRHGERSEETQGDPDRCGGRHGERSEETQRVTQTDVERDQNTHRG